MRLEFRHLEVLVAVEDTGDPAAAARRLDMTVPNLTRSLRRIEDHLGHPVFDGRSGRLVPTAAGLADLAIAREALRAVDGLGPAPRRPASLRLLYYRTPLPGVVAGLRAAHPELTPTLEVASPADGHRLVAAGKADVFVGCVLPHVRWPSRPNLTEHHILSDPTVVLVSRRHRLADADRIDLSELADEDWITVPDPDARHSVVQECRVVGGFDPRITYEVIDMFQIRTLIAEGLGVVFGSSVAPRDEGYVLRPYTGATPSRFTAVYDPARMDTAVVDTVSRLLRTRFAEYGVSREAVLRNPPPPGDERPLST